MGREHGSSGLPFLVEAGASVAVIVCVKVDLSLVSVARCVSAEGRKVFVLEVMNLGVVVGICLDGSDVVTGEDL